MNKIRIEISKPHRPVIPGYGITEAEEGMVTWDEVNRWMDESKNYWIHTTRPNNKPHARPIWGIWYENIFYFGGGPKTRSVKNLRLNANIAVHTESGENVVIIEGKVEEFEDEELHQILGTKYEERYDIFHPPPFWRVIPEEIFCWTMKAYSTSPTKFTCIRK